MEVEVTGPNRDLHSGVYGGAVANPVNVLCKMIASLHDENNRVTIPGFYDKVAELTAPEREALNKAPFDLNEYKKELGIEEILGEKGYTTLERTVLRPYCPPKQAQKSRCGLCQIKRALRSRSCSQNISRPSHPSM
jgi:acetylornithine deacetylase/succinyl-diaminopimelate desuccinylase-like protein